MPKQHAINHVIGFRPEVCFIYYIPTKLVALQKVTRWTEIKLMYTFNCVKRQIELKRTSQQWADILRELKAIRGCVCVFFCTFYVTQNT